MSLTLDQLNTITNDEEMKRLPLQVSADKKFERWWDHVDEIARRATEIDLMVVALHAKLIFQVYPEVEDVRVRWEVEHSRGDTWTNATLHVNHEYHHPDASDLDTELTDAWDEIDDCAALHALHQATEDAMGTRQIEYMDHANHLFSESLKSIEQIDGIIARIDPEIRAFFEQKILSLQVPKSAAKGPGRF